MSRFVSVSISSNESSLGAVFQVTLSNRVRNIVDIMHIKEHELVVVHGFSKP